MISQVDQILAVLGGAGVLLAAFGLALRAERKLLETRLQTFLGREQQQEVTRQAVGAARRVLVDDRHVLLRTSRLGAPAHLLAQAGLSLSPLRFLVLQFLAGVAGLVVARLALGHFGVDLAEQVTVVIILVAGAALGLLLPQLVLRLKRKRRLEKIESQLPITIDTIANAIQAGLSLPQAIDIVARDMPPPLGVELQIVVRELALGLALEDALDQFAARVPLRDVEIFVAAIHIQYRTGGNLSDILRSMAHTVRERLRIRGEIRVLTAQQRMSALIVTALPFFIVFAIRNINPAYFNQILEPGTMRIMLIAAGAGMIGGAYWLNKIAQIDV